MEIRIHVGEPLTAVEVEVLKVLLANEDYQRAVTMQEMETKSARLRAELDQEAKAAAKPKAKPEPKDPEPTPEPEPVVEAAPARDGEDMRAEAVRRATEMVSSGKAAEVKAALASVGAKKVSELSDDQVGPFLTAILA